MAGLRRPGEAFRGIRTVAIPDSAITSARAGADAGCRGYGPDLRTGRRVSFAPALRSRNCRVKRRLVASRCVTCAALGADRESPACARCDLRNRSREGPSPVLATPLYDDLAAEMHEDASARLREHPAALRGCSILRRSSPGVRCERLPGSRWRSRGKRRGQSRRASGFSEHCAGGQLPPITSATGTRWSAAAGHADHLLSCAAVCPDVREELP